VGPQPGTYTNGGHRFVIWLDDPAADLDQCYRVWNYLYWCKPIVTFVEPTWMEPGRRLQVRRGDLSWADSSKGDKLTGTSPAIIPLIGTEHEQSREQYLTCFVSDAPMDRDLLAWVIVHEVGHQSGLVHNNYPEHTMNPNKPGSRWTDPERTTINANWTKFVDTTRRQFFGG
jgi:hypothetical protein